MGDHCRFCYVSCLLRQLNSQFSGESSEADLIHRRILSLSVTKRDENTIFFFFCANYSNFQALWMLTQKLFNTQLGGKGGIHNLKSQTGLSTEGQQCENKHATVTTMWLCVKINTQVWALGSTHGECLGRMGAGAGRVLLASPALSNLQENLTVRWWGLAQSPLSVTHLA